MVKKDWLALELCTNVIIAYLQEASGSSLKVAMRIRGGLRGLNQWLLLIVVSDYTAAKR